jgi:methanogenic corrinoid protein MtbC1
LYSDQDVRRLRLLREVAAAGRAIGQVAPLSTEELEVLAREDRQEGSTPSDNGRYEGLSHSASGLLDECMDAVLGMDGSKLERVLTRSALALSMEELIEGVLVPLLRRVGEMWHGGQLGPGQEHLATAVIRRFLGWLIGNAEGETGPEMVFATPAGHVHELGALLAAATAAGEGWRVIYAGPDLPADEIGRVVRAKSASAVALSAVYGREDPQSLIRELQMLRETLPLHVNILVGGGSAQESLSGREIPGIRLLADLAEFRDAIRSRSP